MIETEPRLFDRTDLWRAVRTKVIPVLRTYPSPRVWIPACRNGATAYAMGIVLREGGLLARCRVYATDPTEETVARAATGQMSSRHELVAATEAYRAAGGTGSLDDHFTDGDQPALLPEIRERFLFAHHNLATDGSLNEFHFVLLEQADELRAFSLVRDSLCPLGVVATDRLPEAEEHLYQPFEGEPMFFRRIR